MNEIIYINNKHGVKENMLQTLGDIPLNNW